MAKAIIQTIAPTPVQRRKRKEETRKGFHVAAAITKKITRSILDYLYMPSAYDPEHERIKAERFLQQQLFEWTQDEPQHEQEQGSFFHYGEASGFDSQP